MEKENGQPKFMMLLVDEGLATAIEFFALNSGYGLRNEGKGGLHFTTIFYDILEGVQQLDVQYQKRKKAKNPNYLDIPTKIKLDKLHQLIAELGRIQKEYEDDGTQNDTV